jgi:acyl-homoserine lactone acylase PvdQ
MKDFGTFPGTENWFYADNRQVAFQQSGRYPKHARGSDVDLPFNGDGSADWQHFDPARYTADYIAASRRPSALEPHDGFIISWNNKEAPGWRKGPTEWGDGPVHRALMLQRHLKAEIAKGGGKVDLTGLTRAVNETATTDLRGEELVGPLLAVIGSAPPASDRPLLKLLADWRASGANRLDANGDNVYDHSAAVALMDAWWPLLVRAEFQPRLGKKLFDAVESNFLGLGGTFSWGWASQVQKDLRATLGRKERGRYSRLYCGPRAACRTKLLASLHAAVATVTKKYGSATPSDWKVPATCDNDTVKCDQIEPNTAGAVATPAFPWQNRGTYHQVIEVAGKR